MMKIGRLITAGLLLAVCLAVWGYPNSVRAAFSQCKNLDPNTNPCADVVDADDAFSIVWSGAANQSSSLERNCALSNVPVGSEMVDITITGTGGGGALEASGMGGAIPFQVQYRDPSGGSWINMDAGNAAAFATLTETAFKACDNNGSDSGGQRMRIRISRNDIDDAPAGIYTGTFTVTADPPGGGVNNTDAPASVSITIPEYMNFSKLKSSFDQGTWDFSGDEFNRDTSICVWSNNRTTFGGAASYDVTVTSDQGSFVLASGANTVPYSVYWASDLGSNITVNNGTQVFYNTPASFMTTGSDQSCSGGTNNAQMLFFWAESDLSMAVGTDTAYSSVVTVEISLPL